MAKARVRQATMVQRSRRVSPQDKALVHQTGKRPFLGLMAEDIRTITTALDDGIRRKAGRRSS